MWFCWAVNSSLFVCTSGPRSEHPPGSVQGHSSGGKHHPLCLRWDAGRRAGIHLSCLGCEFQLPSIFFGGFFTPLFIIYSMYPDTNLLKQVWHVFLQHLPGVTDIFFLHDGTSLYEVPRYNSAASQIVSCRVTVKFNQHLPDYGFHRAVMYCRAVVWIALVLAQCS